jgi:hypothetical protein
MIYALRTGGMTVAATVLGALLLGAWVYTPIPAPPSSPHLIGPNSTTDGGLVARPGLLRIRWVD